VLRHQDDEYARREVTSTEWEEVAVTCMLPVDGTPQWTMGAAGGEACEMSVADLQALVTLPDPLGPGVLPMPEERRPITLATGMVFFEGTWAQLYEHAEAVRAELEAMSEE